MPLVTELWIEKQPINRLGMQTYYIKLDGNAIYLADESKRRRNETYIVGGVNWV